MRRRIATQTEVAGRADQCPAKVMHPDAIDEHPRGQWVVLRHDRAGQAEPAASATEWLAVGGGDPHKLARHGFAGPAGMAALEDAWIVGPRRVAKRHCP